MAAFTSPASPLAAAIYDQAQATIHLIHVALAIEWTIFTRFAVGVVALTVATALHLGYTLRNSRRPLEVWTSLNKPIIKLFRPRIFAYLFGNINPYARTIDMRISTFSRGFCTGIMRDRQKSKDASKRIHTSAIVTFAQTIAELALLSSLPKYDDCTTLLSLTVEHKKIALGLLTGASSVFDMPKLEEGQEHYNNVAITVIVKDRMLETVAIVQMDWAIKTHNS